MVKNEDDPIVELLVDPDIDDDIKFLLKPHVNNENLVKTVLNNITIESKNNALNAEIDAENNKLLLDLDKSYLDDINNSEVVVEASQQESSQAQALTVTSDTSEEGKTKYEIAVNPKGLTEQQFADLLNDDSNEGIFDSSIKLLQDGTAKICTTATEFCSGLWSTISGGDDDQLPVVAAKDDATNKVKLGVDKTSTKSWIESWLPESSGEDGSGLDGVEVVGTDGSTAKTTSGKITFKSADDSNIKVTVAKSGDDIEVTIGVYYK